uniref:Uncharacterized protein n=1 Tax=Arundo donax TaxID=35708 RepID=A0A0A9DPC9_ARUDO
MLLFGSYQELGNCPNWFHFYLIQAVSCYCDVSVVSSSWMVNSLGEFSFTSL